MTIPASIVGDALLQGEIGHTDFPMSNHQDLIDAITTKLWPLGSDTASVPGLGPMSSSGREHQPIPLVPPISLRAVEFSSHRQRRLGQKYNHPPRNFVYY